MPPERRLEANQTSVLDSNSVSKILTLNTGTWIQIEMYSGVDDQNFKALRHRAAGGPPWIIVDSAVPPGPNAIDVGGPALPDTWYYLYIIDSSVGIVPIAGLLSTALDAPFGPGPILPPGYDLKRRVGAVRTDPAGAFLEFRKFGQFALYDDYTKNLVHTGNTPGPIPIPVSVANYVPATAERVLLLVEVWDIVGVPFFVPEFVDIYSEHIGPVPIGPTFGVRAAASFPGATQANTVSGWAHTGGNIYITGTGSLDSFVNIYVLGYWEDIAPAI